MSAFELIQGIRSSARIRRSVLSFFLGGVLLSTTAVAQVSFIGSVATENFGSQSILSPSAAKSFSFSVAAGTKVGSIAVLTTGVAKLDFASVLGTTCTAATYSSVTDCSVNVTFTPQSAGPRRGAVVFFSKANNTGNVLGSVPIYGLGNGAQIAYGPGTVAAVDRTMHDTVGLGNPGAMTTDAAGNLFVLDSAGERPGYSLVKIPPTGAAPTILQPVVDGLALYLPSCVAVDGAGNIYIGDFGRRVVEIPVGSGAATAIEPVVNGIPLNYPSGLAVDGAGDLFIADYINNRVLEIPAGGGAAIALDPKVNGIELNDPHGLSLDGVGDLFIADLGNNRIVKLPLAGGTATAIEPEVYGQGLWNPEDVALDGAGDLFIADNVNHRVVQVPAGGGVSKAIDPAMYFGGTGEVYAVAVDGAGDLFFTQGGLAGGDNIVEEDQYGHNPVANFATPTDVDSTDATDGMQTLQIVNIGNQPLQLTGLSFPADFSQAGGGLNNCTASTTLSPGQTCDLSIEFTPQTPGALSESIKLTDNALNTPGSQQLIQVTGTAEKQAAITSPASGTMLTGSSVTFTWSAGANATGYYLSIGSTGVGSTNLFNSGKRTVLSWPATGLPTNGEPVYVRLTTYFGAILMHTDYTYTAFGAAVLTSPTPGAALSGSTATFSWSAGTGITGYELWLGSTGVGSQNLYNSGQVTSRSVTVTNLPTTGATIYARLISTFNGQQLSIDCTYKAALVAALTSPVAGAALPGPTTTFTWTAATGATGYSLLLGSTGTGSSNLYNSGQITALSATAANLPTNGSAVYARLTSIVNGVQIKVDYTYTAAASAALTSPAPASLLAGPSVTFAWSASSSASGYTLWLGSTGVGSSNLYNSAQIKATSIAVTSLPTNGEKIYARLFTNFKVGSSQADYAFTAATNAAFTSPAAGSILAGPSVTFTWTTGTGATGYAISLGSTGVGSSDVYNSGKRTVNTWIATGVPTTGGKIYVRLTTYFNNVTVYADSTYTAAKQAALTSPAPGAVLAGSAVTFSWTACAQATAYSLWLGSTGVGSNNLYGSAQLTGTSVAVTKLPTTGVTIYARLFTSFNGVQSHVDYTYTAK